MSSESHGEQMRVASPLTVADSYLTDIDAVVDKAGMAVDRVLSQEQLTQEERDKIAASIGEAITRHTSMVLVDGDEFFPAVSELTIAVNAKDINGDTKEAVDRLQSLKGWAIIARNANR